MKRRKSANNNNQETKTKKSILGSLFGKQNPDKTYVTDLKLQWTKMDHKDRIKFILGATVGLILFISALFFVYRILLMMSH